jgi:hypothetical protein
VAKIQQWSCTDPNSSALALQPKVASLTFTQSAEERRKQTVNCHFIHTEESWKEIVNAHSPEVILRLAAWVETETESDKFENTNQPLVAALQQCLSKYQASETGKLAVG